MRLTKKERMLLAEMILYESRLHDVVWELEGVRHTVLVEEAFDKLWTESSIVDKVLDYIGVPADNSADVPDGSPESMCRDGWFQWMFDVNSMSDAARWIAKACEFADQVDECGGDLAKWEKKYGEKFEHGA